MRASGHLSFLSFPVPAVCHLFVIPSEARNLSVGQSQYRGDSSLRLGLQKAGMTKE
jgi:hypothetical protein